MFTLFAGGAKGLSWTERKHLRHISEIVFAGTTKVERLLIGLS